VVSSKTFHLSTAVAEDRFSLRDRRIFSFGKGIGSASEETGQLSPEMALL